MSAAEEKEKAAAKLKEVQEKRQEFIEERKQLQARAAEAAQAVATTKKLQGAREDLQRELREQEQLLRKKEMEHEKVTICTMPGFTWSQHFQINTQICIVMPPFCKQIAVVCVACTRLLEHQLLGSVKSGKHGGAR